MKENTHSIKPDFYVVASHGTGFQSFLYYLRLLQIPSTDWWSHDESFNILKKQFPCCGFTIDHRLSLGDTEPYTAYLQENEAPVFWLVRDPVELITTCVNQRLGDLIMRGMLNSNIEKNYQECLSLRNNFDTFKKILIGKNYFPYQALLRRIKKPENIFVIDTLELLPNKICFTMEKVEFLIKKRKETDMSKMLQKFSVSYNNFDNRSWSHFDYFQIRIGKLILKIKIIPSSISEFHMQRNRYEFCSIEHDKTKYDICFLTNEINKETIEDIVHASHKTVIYYIEKMNSIILKAAYYFNNIKISKDHTLKMLLSNKYETSNFVKMQSGTLQRIQDITGRYPDHWKSFNTLGCIDN